MVQRLALAGAAVTGSAVLVLDEVLTGADPLVASRLRLHISKLAASGRIVMIASHDLATLEKLATRVLLLWQGRLVADVRLAQLLTERVAELSLNSSTSVSTERLIERFPGSVQTAEGVAVPLTGGLTVEKVLATCRTCRVAVSASRVRYRALEDILHEAASRLGGNRE
jgi:ABC-2 type transport system ATP-binding protein